MPASPIRPTRIAATPANTRKSCASMAPSSRPSSTKPRMPQLHQAMFLPPQTSGLVWPPPIIQATLRAVELRDTARRGRESIAPLENLRYLAPCHSTAVDAHPEPAARPDV